jgi:hypothetical protein
MDARVKEAIQKLREDGHIREAEHLLEYYQENVQRFVRLEGEKSKLEKRIHESEDRQK